MRDIAQDGTEVLADTKRARARSRTRCRAVSGRQIRELQQVCAHRHRTASSRCREKKRVSRRSLTLKNEMHSWRVKGELLDWQ